MTPSRQTTIATPEVLALAFGLALLSGCAIGQKQRFDDVLADVAASGQGRVAVATQDHRPYVVAGEEPPQFVGYARGGYGNKFDVTTVSGNPFAVDVTMAVSRSLRAKGFESVPLVVRPLEAPAALAERIRRTGASRAVVVTLSDWKTDTYNGTALIYDVSLRVVDAAGSVMAEHAVHGRDNLGASLMSPGSVAKEKAPQSLQSKLQQLLNNERVITALEGPPDPTPQDVVK